MQKELFQLTLEHLRERYVILSSFLISFLLSFICYGRTLFSAYTPDDYLYNVQQIPLAFFLQQGRFVQGFIVFIFNKLNISMTFSGFAFEILFYMSLSICSTCFVYYLSSKNSFLISFILSTAIIICNPIFSSMAAYHGAVINFTFSFLFLTLFFCYTKNYIEQGKVSNLIIATISLILICGSYQPCLPIAIIWSIFYSIIHYQSYSIRNLLNLYSPIIIGVILYAILYIVTKNAAGTNNWDPRVGFIAPSEIRNRISEITTYFSTEIWQKYQIIPKKAYIAIAINLFIFLISYRLQSFKKYVLLFLTLIICILLILFPVSIVKIWAPVSRIIIGVAFCYGILFLYVKDSLIIRTINYTFAILIIFCSIIISNAFLSKLQLDNTANEWLSSNLAIDLLKVDNEKEIAIVDNHNRLKTAEWSFRGLFYTHTGNLFHFVPSNQNDKNVCIKTPIWPQKDSIHIINNKVVVCL